MNPMNPIVDYLARLFSTDGFPARWWCGQWSAFHGWLYILSDLAIWGAYFAIPLILLRFVTGKRDLPFPRIFWLFAAFICACGITHLMDALMFWWPAYRLTGLVYLVTAAISWATVIALIPVIPLAFALRTPQELEREIVERKRVEAQLQEVNEQLRARTRQLEAINKELETFSYSVSHDLRAPLRTIDGFSQALLEDWGEKLDEDGKRYLHWIREGALQMAQLIDGILSLSRLTRGEVEKGTVDLSALAREVADDLQSRQGDRRVEFVIRDGLTAHADKRLIRAVFQNLLGNAWKYTAHHDTARIEFGLDRQNGQAVYFVKDDGAGFDMSYAHKLFGVFQRLHDADEFPGSGIGLATVQRIIHRHDGDIWAEAAVEKGAIFYFTIEGSEHHHGEQ